MIEILITDAAGQPREWTDMYEAVNYHCRGKVLFTIGDVIKTFHGGHNDKGEQSKVDINPIIGCSGPLVGEKWMDRTTTYTERGILYGRDQNMCGYCGRQFLHHKLTIDHVLPKSRYKEFGKTKGQMNVWTNCVTACKNCNHRKAARTPDEANMPLLYVPYTPNAYEKMILKGKNVLTDQMEFLMARVPRTSRLWSDDRYKDLRN
jgi:hypothetical protein